MSKSWMGVVGGRVRIAGLAIGLAAVGLMGGCVTQGDWDNLYATNRSLKDQVTTLTQERDEYRNSAEILRQQLVREQEGNAQLRTQVGNLQSMFDQAQARLVALGEKIDNASFTQLDPETDTLLKELAEKYPDLIIYDADRGRLRFASDLTFDSGSDVVKDSALQSLRALANILTSGAASAYDVHIVGHTDSQRIGSGTARNHPTNMHLSCHRAISVRGQLASMGVPAEKMEAAGWGEFRPIVQNTGSGNTPQNRRVEIYLTRPKGESASLGAPAPASNRTVPATDRTLDRQPDITK
ncbi:MAG: OmpA family protein [Phycisphaerales bacterium]|nr:OmpA family protein [Phycisphaerales bacterium]